MKLNELSPPKGARRNSKRIGRGPGSGHGKTAGRGTKGQKSRSGGNIRPGYEGGQMPLQRRLPKRGFTNIFEKDAVIDKAVLIDAGLLRRSSPGVKLLGQGSIDYPLVLKVDQCSKSAREKIEAAGGTIELIKTGVVE